METGIELISKERQKQIEKHGFTGKHHSDHPEWYDKRQMIEAANHLTIFDLSSSVWFPENWDEDWFYNIMQKPYEKRLIIAGALIASEIDRLQELNKLEENGETV